MKNIVVIAVESKIITYLPANDEEFGGEKVTYLPQSGEYYRIDLDLGGYDPKETSFDLVLK